MNHKLLYFSDPLTSASDQTEVERSIEHPEPEL